MYTSRLKAAVAAAILAAGVLSAQTPRFTAKPVAKAPLGPGPVVAQAHANTTRVTLSEPPLSLFDADGSAIVLHGNPDPGITGQPGSGVSGGPRLAGGVIQKN